ncbi:hypothetical protein BVX94_00670 [bacterium B17]|nr:hypothetical protein BVX94_00670 [bacterium B17]
MKSFIFIPFALLLGLLVGSWSPRAEIASLKQELASTKKMLKKQPERKRSISEVTSLLGIEGIERSRKKETEQKEEIVKEEKTIDDAVEEKAVEPVGSIVEESKDTDVVEESGEEKEAPPEMTQKEKEAKLDEAVELWKIRVNVARSTFISNTGMNDQQAMQFDMLLDNMNLKIGETIDVFAENIEDAEEVQMEAGIRVMNDITESIVATYDAMDESMPKGWRRNTGENFTLVNFIDPEVGRPLVGLEDKLENMDADRN